MAKKPPTDAAVDAYISSLEGDVRKVAEQVRALIFSAVPAAVESFKWGQPVYATAVPFCYFKAARNHVSVGFHKGAALDDPAGLLEGEGKSMRHVKIGVDARTIPAGIKPLIVQAANL